MTTIQFSRVKDSHNIRNSNRLNQPVNGDILIYMQILHVNDIKTVEQTFNAKFYLSATWAQKWKPNNNTSNTSSSNSSQHEGNNTPTKPPPGHNFHIHDDGGNWPYDLCIYRPSLSFDNATTVMQLKDQKLITSSWRDYQNVHAVGSLHPACTSYAENSGQSGRQCGIDPQDSNDVKIEIHQTSGGEHEQLNVSTLNTDCHKNHNIDVEEYVVLEWKANGSGTFTYDINLENYPCDIQLLKIAIASLDRGISLHDDKQDGVQSKIRKDYVLDLGFQFLEIEEGQDVDRTLSQSITNDRRSAFQKKNKYDKWSRLKPVNPKDSTSGPRGVNLKSKEETIQIHERGDFPVLSYYIPVQRLRQAMKEIAIPISLISFASFASFIFKPNMSDLRLTVSLTVALVTTTYSLIVKTYVPSLKRDILYTKHAFYSLVLVFLVVIMNAIVALFYCRGFCDPEDAEFEGPMEIQIADWVICGLLLCWWLCWNSTLYYGVYCKWDKREEYRILEEMSDENVNESRFHNGLLYQSVRHAV